MPAPIPKHWKKRLPQRAMWNKYLLWSLAILLSAFATSCNKSSNSKADNAIKKFRNSSLPDSSWNRLTQHYPSFTFKAKVDYEDALANYSFIANIRIAHDSMIWASFTGPMGVEVARVLIDLDSVRIWNRINATKTTQPIAYLNKYLPFNPDFFSLEDFLMGNPLNISSRPPVVDSSTAITEFKQDDLAFFIVHNADMKNYTLSSILLKDKMVRQQMDITFGSYRPVAQKQFSCTRNINIKRGEENIKISADIYKHGTAGSLEFPFW